MSIGHNIQDSATRVYLSTDLKRYSRTRTTTLTLPYDVNRVPMRLSHVDHVVGKALRTVYKHLLSASEEITDEISVEMRPLNSRVRKVEYDAVE